MTTADQLGVAIKRLCESNGLGPPAGDIEEMILRTLTDSADILQAFGYLALGRLTFNAMQEILKRPASVAPLEYRDKYMAKLKAIAKHREEIAAIEAANTRRPITWTEI